MADATYHKSINNHLWKAGINLLGGAITVLLCDATYTPNTSITGDEFFGDIPGGSIVGSALLTGCTLTDGVFDADDTPVLSPTAGKTVTQLILYQAGSPAPLIRLINGATGLPKLTDGSTFNIIWPNDANRIFRTHDAP